MEVSQNGIRERHIRRHTSKSDISSKDYQRVLSEIELYNSTVDECDVVSRVKADQLAAMMDSVSLNTDERI